MRPHGFQFSVGPSDFVWGAEPLPCSLFVEGDMMLHSWKHFLSNDAFDLLCIDAARPETL